VRVPQVLHSGVPKRLVLGGALSTTVLAVAGVGAGAVPGPKDAIAETLRLNGLHGNQWVEAVCTLLTLVAMIGLVSCWWRLRTLLVTLSPRALLMITALWSLPLIFAPPLFSRDLYAYAGQGHLVANHIDPYVYGPGDLEPTSKWSYNVDGVWRYSPAPYGPVWLWLSGRIVAVADNHLVPAIILLRLAAVVGLVLIAWTLPILARQHGVAPQRALWLGLANPFVLLHGVAGGHNDIVMVGLLVAGLAVAGRTPTTGRLVGAAVLITTAALVKLPAVAALGFLPMIYPGWTARFRAGATVLGTAAVTAVSLTAATGLGWGWLGTLNAGASRLSIFSPVTGLGVALGNALKLVGVVSTPTDVINVAAGAGLAAAVLLGIALLLRAHKLGPVRALALTMVAVVALGPIVQPWYLLWGLIPLAAVGGERTKLPLGALSIALCLALLPNGRSLIRPPLYGGPVLVAVAFSLYLVRRTGRQLIEEGLPVGEPVKISV
jgi:alpha-1,6-mannosyltransferase